MKPGPALQNDLFEVYNTAKPGNPLFCHQEFLEKLSDHRSDAVGKRAALLLHRLLVDERRQHYKSTRGANRGWRRSRLGGKGGSHFYAWWAPRDAPPLKGLKEFSAAPAGSIFLRDIRHHDDHGELKPDSLEQQYLPIAVRELRRQEYTPAPWTPGQSQFSSARQRIRVLKGHPGSGKTTALWNAADSSGQRSILYVTYSAELAALARDHFDKFCPAHKKFQVVTYSRLLAEILGASEPAIESHRQGRARFLKEVAGLSPRFFGPWADARGALYDEMHAHLVGFALPISIGRFPACDSPRLPDKAYREHREWAIGREAANSLLEVANTLRKRANGAFEERFFPEPYGAWKAAQTILRGGPAALAPRGLLAFDCLAVDEAQDLTPIESLVLILLVQAAGAGQKDRIPVLIAGDEAQTVRPTDFEWGWFHDLLHHRLGQPAGFRLEENVRSPRRIAELVNRVWELYSNVAKHDRPSGAGMAQIDEDASDQVLYCSAVPGPELDQLLTSLSEREGLAIICLDEQVPDYVPEQLRGRVLTVFEAKGLDFHSVCILDAGKHLHRILRSSERIRRDSDIEPLSKRLAIDQLRVSISRPTERLYWLDISPSDALVRQSLAFLNCSREFEVSPGIPAVILKTLEEELLDVEERIRLCESDALQYLAVKPDMAWTRAKQAAVLLGVEGAKDAIADETVRQSAHLTLAQASFCLAFRRSPLGAELGRPDLYGEAVRHATLAGRFGLARMLAEITAFERTQPGEKLSHLLGMATALVRQQSELASWLLAEIGPQGAGWLDQLERALARPDLAGLLIDLLPPLYQIFGVLNAERRAQVMREQALKTLVTAGKHKDVLQVLAKLPERQPKLEAECYEGLGDHRAAAESYLKAGSVKDALRNYRAIPDFEQTLALLRQMPDHPAAESLIWVEKMRELAAQRPESFNRVITPAEKKVLQELLEASLGVTRKRKTAAKRTTSGRRPGRPRKPQPSGPPKSP